MTSQVRAMSDDDHRRVDELREQHAYEHLADEPHRAREGADLADAVLVQPITRGATVFQHSKLPLYRHLRTVDLWSRYRLTCRCGKARSVEAKLGGYSCAVLHDHPRCRCECGDRALVVKWLGWVVA